MYEKQPILMALIKTGYIGAPCLKGFRVNEKKEEGMAVIQLERDEKPHSIYWDKDKDMWVEKKPAYYIHPSIIERHYKSAI
jgi:hypothetical protein